MEGFVYLVDSPSLRLELSISEFVALPTSLNARCAIVFQSSLLDLEFLASFLLEFGYTPLLFKKILLSEFIFLKLSPAKQSLLMLAILLFLYSSLALPLFD